MSNSFEGKPKSRILAISAAGATASALLLVLPPLMGWTAVDLKYGDLISAAGFVLTLVVLFGSVVPSVVSMAETARSAHYSQLDAMYLDILRTALDKPYLRSPSTLTGDQRAEYEIYAYLVWNFLETVRDRCEHDETLQSIWGPAIAVEHGIHRDWFVAETVPYTSISAPRFRVEFADFIWKRFWVRPKLVSGNALLPGGDWILKPWNCRERAVIQADPEVQRFLHPQES
ncbi:MAG TPA: hypothetical protein VIT38_15805 [Allosphingosinicella sp.]